jgi:cell division septal protein FtsQ
MWRKKRQPYYGRIKNIYIPTPKPRKEKKVPWFFIKLIFVFAIIGGLLYLIFFSPVFLIKRIKIDGSANNYILQLTEEAKNHNLWLYPKSRLQAEILKSAEVASVSIARRPPNLLLIKITQKSEGIVVMSQDKMYLLDNSGYVIKEVTETSLPVVFDLRNMPLETGQQVLSPNCISFIKNVFMKFSTVTGLPLKKVQIPVETTLELIVETEGFRVIFDTQANIDEQLANLTKVYQIKKDEIKEYMDLRIKDRVIYK